MQLDGIHLACACPPPIAPVIAGRSLACSRCLTPMTAGASAEGYLSSALPSDVRCSATFNRACAAGLVPGAEKRGRQWWAPVEGWASYRRGVGARLRAKRVPKALPVVLPLVSVDDDVMRELGARRAG